MTWVCDRGTFIHIPKCAGHSVMAQYPGHLYYTGWLHQRRSQILADYTWTIIRHPITRLISYWLYKKETNLTKLGCIEWLDLIKPKSMSWYLDGHVDEILRFEEIPSYYPKKNKNHTSLLDYYIQDENIKEYIIEKYKIDFNRFKYKKHV